VHRRNPAPPADAQQLVLGLFNPSREERRQGSISQCVQAVSIEVPRRRLLGNVRDGGTGRCPALYEAAALWEVIR
jgi:hypothetical protein